MSFSDLVKSTKKRSSQQEEKFATKREVHNKKRSSQQEEKFATKKESSQQKEKDWDFQIAEQQDTFENESQIINLDDKINKIESSLINTKEFVSSLNKSLSNSIAEIESKLRSEIIQKQSKMSYSEFKQFILDNKTKGTHYSSYCKQLTSKNKKESDFKNFYLIYLDL